MEKIILASSSPRRKEILNQLRIPFKVITPDIDEETYLNKDIKADELVKILAMKKVMAVAKKLNKSNYKWILGVDTVVTINNQILGKPQNRDEAKEMLTMLSGNTHNVISGIALLPHSQANIGIKTDISEVKFKKMANDEILFYLNTEEWKGVAGAYRIQECASFFIEQIKGSYSNIVGLPISVFYGMLKENDYNFL